MTGLVVVVKGDNRGLCGVAVGNGRSASKAEACN